MKQIVKIQVGSFLYGTNTEESDNDIKGVYIPNMKELILGNIHKGRSFSTGDDKTRNTKEDKDITYYSVHEFIKLACMGETGAIEMLFAPDNMVLETSDHWKFLVKNRYKFFTKELKAFIGFARSQMFRFGMKAERLETARKVLKILNKGKDSWAIGDRRIWYKLICIPSAYIHTYNTTIEKGREISNFNICGKIIQETTSIEYAKKIIQNFITKYGERVKKAADNKNIDWKSVSHSLRVAFELKQIYEEGVIIFPLKDARYLTQIKEGVWDYHMTVIPKLEELMDEVEVLAKKSNFPEKVNRKFFDKFILDVYGYDKKKDIYR
jgi:predicted nucleotidyltransferase